MSYADYFRHPHTKNEMKQYFASNVNEPDTTIKVRGLKRPKSLPTSWDDYYRNNMPLRKWESYRKNQWKE